ncbi:MAG: hypothetical protein Kow0075_04370 [Salibacteraceae bacterium]
MKTLSKGFAAIIWLLLITAITACSTSNNVVDNGVFQKRKYRKGYHFNGLGQIKSQTTAGYDKRHRKTNTEGLHGLAMQPVSPEVLTAENDLNRHESVSLQLDKDREPLIASRVKDQLPADGSSKRSDDLARLRAVNHQAAHAEDGLEEVDDEIDKNRAVLSLLMGIGAWFFGLLGIFLVVLSLVGLLLAILAMVLGGPLRKQYGEALAGYILGLSYVILFTLMLILTIILLVLIFLALASL